jgi:hypothetical protein
MDIDAPKLHALEVETASVTAGEGLVLYTVTGKDAGSGPIEAETRWVSPTGDQSLRSTAVMTNGETGIFKGAFTIPEWYEGGEWKCLMVSLKDNAGNQQHYFEPTTPAMQGRTVQVIQDPARVDKVAPQALAVQFSKPKAEAGEAVTITALVADDHSGLESVQVYVLSETGLDSEKVELKSLDVNLNRPSKIPEPNVWSGSFSIKPDMELGAWKIARLGVSDRARNYRTYFYGRDPVLDGVTVTFTGEDVKKAKAPPATTDGGKP